MESLEPKKLALIRILQILQENTDCDHPLTQGEIAELLEKQYGITVERKAVGRNLVLLSEAGYDIVTTKSGSFLASRPFEDSELRLLIDGVLSSRHITETHSGQLIARLASLSSKYFKSHIKNVYSVRDWGKSRNAALFYNIDIIDEAIAQNRKIRFDYNKYGADKKLHRSATHTVSPYQMILHNQRYFLMAYQEKWQHISYFRLDHITGIVPTEERATPLRGLRGYENGVDYKRFSASLPYMYSDEPVPITFAIHGEWLIDQIIDWFGFDFRLEEKDGKLLVSVTASPNAMEYWLMQYLNHVEVLSPVDLRERIQKNIAEAYQKYHTEVPQ